MCPVSQNGLQLLMSSLDRTPELTKWLVELGVPPAPLNCQETALHCLATSVSRGYKPGEDEEMAELLVKAGNPIDALTRNRYQIQTALLLSAWDHHFKFMERLLDLGADPKILVCIVFISLEFPILLINVEEAWGLNSLSSFG